MRIKMSKQPPPAPTASAVGPCPTVIQIVGRPGTGSLPSTFAPPDHPREKERERIEESKNVQTTPTRTYCKRKRPLPYYHPNCRTPRHWKFTQDHRTTPPNSKSHSSVITLPIAGGNSNRIPPNSRGWLGGAILVGWLVGCIGFNGPLRQYFSLYRAVFQREGERGERIDESKNVQTTPTRTYYNAQ